MCRPKNGETPVAPTTEVSNLLATYEKPTMKSVAKVKAEFTIFKFGESEIRVLDKNGDPWFVAQDVCAALKIQNVTQTIERLDEDERSMFNIGLKSNPMFDSRVREINLVSESGMYTLVLRCRDAVNKGSVPHTFRKWVTAEVLPSVRKSGFYQKPVSDKKTRLSSATQLTPLRQTAERLITTGIGKIYPDIWKLVHQKFEIEHIHQLRPEQVFEAVEFLNAIEGEYLGKANKQLSLPISYSMEYFNQYRWMNGINEQSLSAPWRYPANMLTPNGDNPNPIGHMLGEMRQMGYEVDAALFQLQSLQHHLEMIRHKIDRAQMSLR